MSDPKKQQRPGVVTEHEIRLNLRLLRGRDGPLFKTVHEMVSQLRPRHRVEAVRRWMMMAAATGSGEAGSTSTGVEKSTGSEYVGAAHTPSVHKDAPTPHSATSSGPVVDHADKGDGKLDLSQLEGIEMDFDFVGGLQR